MIGAPWIFPDSKSIFWAMLGICIFLMTITICYLLLTGRIGAFQADVNGFSFDMTRTEDVIKLAKEGEDSLQIINGLLERERFYKLKIARLEEQLGSSIKLPFSSKPDPPELKEIPKVEVGGKVVEIGELREIVQAKGRDLKDTQMKLEVQQEIQSRMQQQQQQGVPAMAPR